MSIERVGAEENASLGLLGLLSSQCSGRVPYSIGYKTLEETGVDFPENYFRLPEVVQNIGLNYRHENANQINKSRCASKGTAGTENQNRNKNQKPFPTSQSPS